MAGESISDLSPHLTHVARADKRIRNLTGRQKARMGYQSKPDQTDGERIASIETLVGDMHTRLFGNGQPGELASIRDRISKLESWFWRAVGACAVILFVLERIK